MSSTEPRNRKKSENQQMLEPHAWINSDPLKLGKFYPSNLLSWVQRLG